MSLVHADVAVIGGELCGAAAAALLAQAGQRVVVLGHLEPPHAKPLGGLRVPVFPTLWRLPSPGVVADFFDQLGLRQRVRHEFGERDGVCLVDDPDIRLVLVGDATHDAVEMTRVFGADGPRLLTQLTEPQTGSHEPWLFEATQLHDDGFWGRRRRRKRLAGLGPERSAASISAALSDLLQSELGAVLPLLCPFVHHGGPSISPAHLGGWLAGLLSQGVRARFPDAADARSALVALLMEAVRGHGGEIVSGADIREVELSGKRVLQIKTDGSHDYAVRAVIDATVSRSFGNSLPQDKHATRYRDDTQVPGLRGRRAIVRWLLPRESLPAAMPSFSVLLPEHHDGLAILLGRFEHLAPEDRRKTSCDDLVAVVAAAGADPTSEFDLVGEIDTRLEQFLPFAKPSVVAHDVLAAEEVDAAFPWYERVEGGNCLGGRSVRTPLKNVFRAGRDVVPHFGLDAELAAARAVCSAVHALFGKSKAASPAQA